MFIERKLNPASNKVELWEAEWMYSDDRPAEKTLLRCLGEEQPMTPSSNSNEAWNKKSAVCWVPGRTLGNIAVFSREILGLFPDNEGEDAVLPCDLVKAGKFRHGAQRWWCRTHQTHWGTKADLVSSSKQGVIRCSNFLQPMNYVLDPLEIDVDLFAEVGIWCSLPAALSSECTDVHEVKIHVHLREKKGIDKKLVDDDFGAVSVLYSQDLNLFDDNKISRISITPPAALDFVLALEEGRELDCICCNSCGYPHLDLGDFAKTPHRKHFCGNCGRDSLWSRTPIVSTPLKPLYERLTKNKGFMTPNRTLNLDNYKECSYSIWASTPAIIWTSERSQEKGIHVHVEQGGNRIVDETFGRVILNGKELNRNSLFQRMVGMVV